MENELPVQYTKGIINSNVYTRKYFDSFAIEMRLIDSQVADTSAHFLGADFKTPIMIGVAKYPKVEGVEADIAKMTAQLGSAICFSMRVKDEVVQQAVAAGAKVIIIVKPYRDNQQIIDTIHHFEELGVFAVGCDIDHAYNKNGEMDGQPNGLLFGPKTVADLKEIVNSTKLPFIAKGVLSAYDAIKCKEAGVAAICVSHHNSIMDDAVPPLMVLPEIRKAVGPDYPIAIDCCVTNGADAFKCLAFGANVVWIARAVMGPAAKEQAAGAEKVVQLMTQELKHYMDRTSSPDIEHIDPTVLHQVHFDL